MLNHETGLVYPKYILIRDVVRTMETVRSVASINRSICINNNKKNKMNE